MNTKTVLSAAAVALALAACGNKGPLVMPQEPVPAEQEVPVPPPAAEPATDPALQDPTDADAADDPGADADG
ncbi:LPS translocon maturation chaperone LptM [Pseudoxanthomonas suwonensis]|uniref:Sugar transporter n=1 Tax=Pseudoxanthomonas suwonensis TaxID=314722 RepID=A0A0E3Z0E4_9GAMM|nr:lipoprotein [Pseudoxanthomonas suwonensis]AKC86482.1 hypothetical protein WQ53_06585 [Pseudoxanthomonas suwonensis]